jgi:nitroreductase
MDAFVKAMMNRTSCRTFLPDDPDDSSMKEIEKFISENRTGPFRNSLSFKWMTFSGDEEAELKQLISYGIFRNVRHVLAGWVEKGEMDLVDFGFAMEKNMLYAQRFGLAGCWVGGTFRRSRFVQRLELPENALLPAVAVMGYPADRRSWTDRSLRWMVRSGRRKPWADRFFCGDLNTPLTREKAGRYAFPLEMVRWAPSASNRQPWRIVMEPAGNRFDFYLAGKRKRTEPLPTGMLGPVDMGISFCHFQLAAESKQLKGKWVRRPPDRGQESLFYIASWEAREKKE